MDEHPTMNDLDLLIDYEKDSRIASVAYLTSACEAHDPELKDVFLDFSKGAVKHQERFVEMIKKIGGEV
ncbi:MAG TPA: spore coat protein [Candidatus Deferrimicrobium sp.]|nr:spore coat protein [Candidatus Deferrimicrobium sp.]